MSKKINDGAILGLFFDEPGEYHLREVARRMNLSPATARKYLDHFVARKLLRCGEVRGNVVYSPNSDEPAFIFEKKLWNLRRIRESGLLEYLDTMLAYPTVVLFGSYAKGENRRGSDIDLLVVTRERAALDLAPFERKLKGPFQLFFHTKEEIRSLRKKSPELLNNMINGTILTGYLEVV